MVAAPVGDDGMAKFVQANGETEGNEDEGAPEEVGEGWHGRMAVAVLLVCTGVEVGLLV
ncbi:MAG: hypothetical protein AAGC93_31300 [Cyanobacteria bacterium P01_F01_bin.53]